MKNKKRVRKLMIASILVLCLYHFTACFARDFANTQVDMERVIAQNLEGCCNSTNGISSNPYDYIDNEFYETIVNLGDDAIAILERNIKNGEYTGLTAYIAALAIQDISGYNIYEETGVDWATADEFLELWTQFKMSNSDLKGATVHTLDPVELIYCCGIFSFVQTAEMAPMYQITDKMFLCELRDDNEKLELGFLEQIEITEEDATEWFIENYDDPIFGNGKNSWKRIVRDNYRAWQLCCENGGMYMLLEQKNGTIYLGVGSRNLQSDESQTGDTGKIRWIYKMEVE